MAQNIRVRYMKKIAITGASGYLGQFITSYLLKKDFKIKGLTRNINTARDLFPQVEWVQGELSADFDYTKFLTGCNGLIHAAFDHIKGRYRGGEGHDIKGFLTKNLNGSLNLLNQANKLSFGVFISSRAVYGSVEKTTEDSPLLPDSHYGVYKAKVEEYITSNKLPFAILRPTGVYGIIKPFHQTKWYELIKTIKQGQSFTTHHAGTEVHGDDLAKAVYLLLNPYYKGQIFNCSDFLISHRQIVQEIYDIYSLTGALPPLPTRHVIPMQTEKLKSIGWQASGKEKLIETLKKIYENI